MSVIAKERLPEDAEDTPPETLVTRSAPGGSAHGDAVYSFNRETGDFRLHETGTGKRWQIDIARKQKVQILKDGTAIEDSEQPLDLFDPVGFEGGSGKLVTLMEYQAAPDLASQRALLGLPSDEGEEEETLSDADETTAPETAGDDNTEELLDLMHGQEDAIRGLQKDVADLKAANTNQSAAPEDDPTGLRAPVTVADQLKDCIDEQAKVNEDQEDRLEALEEEENQPEADEAEPEEQNDDPQPVEAIDPTLSWHPAAVDRIHDLQTIQKGFSRSPLIDKALAVEQAYREEFAILFSDDSSREEKGNALLAIFKIDRRYYKLVVEANDNGLDIAEGKERWDAVMRPYRKFLSKARRLGTSALKGVSTPIKALPIVGSGIRWAARHPKTTTVAGLGASAAGLTLLL